MIPYLGDSFILWKTVDCDEQRILVNFNRRELCSALVIPHSFMYSYSYSDIYLLILIGSFQIFGLVIVGWASAYVARRFKLWAYYPTLFVAITLMAALLIASPLPMIGPPLPVILVFYWTIWALLVKLGLWFVALLPSGISWGVTTERSFYFDYPVPTAPGWSVVSMLILAVTFGLNYAAVHLIRHFRAERAQRWPNG
jgi:hypothetical protein